ncbi:hypothetical protein [Acidipila sp. EB88]|uniref:hypothetical protein n=1 Tax=Acidipila sp. EB88 TaxID=2305226 RepID=UPI000F5DFC0B|nr:hypothetical protein [Acidipila sp. EB88]
MGKLPELIAAFLDDRANRVMDVSEAQQIVLRHHPEARIARGKYGHVWIEDDQEVLSKVIGAGTRLARVSSAWIDAAGQLLEKRPTSIH